MKILAPVRITDGMLLSSNLPENDHPEWSAGQTYAAGARVKVAALHSIFEAVKTTTGEPPQTSPAAWLRAGPTNRWAMFDDLIGTASTGINGITIELRPGAVSAIAVIGARNAGAVHVTLTDPAEGIVFDKTTQLTSYAAITNWWEYFFSEIAEKETVVVDDIPLYRNATVRIELAGSNVSVSTIAVGLLKTYGDGVVESSPQIGIDDYSVKRKDEFGNVTLVERSWARRVNWRLKVKNSEVDFLFNTLTALRARPAIYIGSDVIDNLSVYGYYKDFSITVAYPNHSDVSIQIEGVT